MNTYRYAKARALIISGAVLLAFLLVPAMFTAFFSSAANVFIRSDLTVLSDLLLTAAGYLLALFLIVKRYRKSKKPLNEILGLFPHKFAQWRALGFLVSGFALGTAVSAALSLLPKQLTESYNAGMRIDYHGAELFVWLATVLVIAPLSEEIIFRRFVLGALQEAFSVRASVIVSAAVFAILHVQLLWIFYAFAMGLLFGRVAADAGDLTMSASMHVGFNTSILPMVLLPAHTSAYRFLFGNRWMIAGYLAAGAAGGGFLLWKLLEEKKSDSILSGEAAR